MSKRTHLTISTLLTLLFIALSTSATTMPTPSKEDLSLVPAPLSLERLAGELLLTKRTSFLYSGPQSGAREVAEHFATLLRKPTGFPLPVALVDGAKKDGAIVFALVDDASLGQEGYHLEVAPTGATVRANAPAGLFYGSQTLLQLLPPKAYANKHARGVRWSVPCVRVKDVPRFRWRGMHLDVSRHFFSKDFVKKFIDYLAMHKMNTFHWHLTDDQGWRIEVKRYPELTKVSAWRTDMEDIHWRARREQRPGEQATYGGYYTQEEIREVVQYARERFVTIVPEIEMPAHATAVLTAYPQLSCTGGPFTVPTGGIWPIKDIFCGGNDSVYTFLENVLSEVVPLFPGEYVHIGGDEANKTEWKRCLKCQARIKREGLKNEDELQSYFIKRIVKILTSMNKRVIGWDEIIEGGLAPEATVMSWRGTQGGIVAAREGHDVVMTPTTNCYLDYYQGDPANEPLAIGGYLPLRNVFAFDPTVENELTPEQAKHILGVQGNIWTEYIPTPAKAEYMGFPRIAAIAELGWSPKEKRPWEDFVGRIEHQMDRYTSAGINAARSLYAVSMSDTFDTASWKRIVTLDAQIGSDCIRYTLDGSQPGPTSPAYSAPLPLTKSTTIKAVTFVNGRQMGPVTSRRYPVSLSGEKGVSLVTPFDDRFGKPGGAALVDGQLARPTSSDKKWRGVRGSGLDAVIDLGEVRPIHRVGVNFLHESDNLVFLPDEVQVALSTDGTTFSTVASLSVESLLREPRPFVKEYAANAKGTKGRYVKITAKNPGVTPDWHKKGGEPTWLYVDEVTVE